MQQIDYQITDRIAYITLNRPEKRNAFNRGLVSELKEAFSNAEKDLSVKVIVLKAEGKIFCAGADLEYLQSLQKYTFEENLEDSAYLKDLYLQIYTHPKVVIAAVQGHAIAGGCGLITVCDFVFSVPEALFGYSEVKIGFVPAIVMTFLIRKIGEARAKEMLLSGDLITAHQAKEFGIINTITSENELLTKVTEFGLCLCETNSGQAMTTTKQMIANIQTMDLTEALAYGARVNAEARAFKDCKLGIAAFLNKEKYKWN
jgi:methylglutaconyl-CoA hydratase